MPIRITTDVASFLVRTILLGAASFHLVLIALVAISCHEQIANPWRPVEPWAVRGALSMALLRKYWGFVDKPGCRYLLNYPWCWCWSGGWDSNPLRLNRRFYRPVPLSNSTASRCMRLGESNRKLSFSVLLWDRCSLTFRIGLAPILWRERSHRRLFLFLKGVLVYALIHLWWTLPGSNRSPLACKASALPTMS